VNKKINEEYANELTARYIELRRWACEHWPNTAQPLTAADFIATERELGLLLGARLHPAGPDHDGPADPDSGYLDVTPMPWP